MSRNSSDPAGPRAAGGRTRLRANPPGSVARRPREPARPPALPLPFPLPSPSPAWPGEGRGPFPSPPPHGRPAAVAPPGRETAARALARHASPGPAEAWREAGLRYEPRC